MPENTNPSDVLCAYMLFSAGFQNALLTDQYNFLKLHTHKSESYNNCCILGGWLGSVVGIETTGWTARGSNPGRGEIFRTCPDRPWGPPTLLYNWYRVFPGSKERPGRDADSSPP
jgi:hypothetical protein